MQFNENTNDFENMPPGVTMLDLTFEQIIFNEGFIVHLINIGFFGKWSTNRSEHLLLILKTFAKNKSFSEDDVTSDLNIFCKACDALWPFLFNVEIPEDLTRYINIWHMSLRYLLSVEEHRQHLEALQEYFTLFDQALFINAKTDVRKNKFLSKKERESLNHTLDIWEQFRRAIEFIRKPVEEVYTAIQASSPSIKQ